MHLLQLLLTTICVIFTVTGQDATICLDGRMPANCEDVTDPCDNAVCPDYAEAACRVDACNNCSRLFYDEETGTVLKCNNEPLLCASCFTQDGSTCGGPGTEVQTEPCDQDQICGAFEAIFEIENYEINVFYRGCVVSHTFESNDPSCYENEDVKDHLISVFNGGDIKHGYGCVCTEDICNNFDLYTYPNEEIISCVDDVGLWFNPGVFLVDTECDVRFCDNTGEFRCITEEPTFQCEFDDYSYANGESFKSGIGDCICNNGDISCTEGDQPELVCYTSATFTDDINGIEICDEDSVCLVGTVTQSLFFIITTYERGCYKRAQLDIENAGCTTSFEDIQEAFPDSHPDDFYSICVCNTSFCNEQLQLEEPVPGANCAYNGDVVDHNYEFSKDECNLCKCHHGEIFCTSHSCNGLQCYSCIEDTLDGILDCGITICQKGEVCANLHIQTFGFLASLSVEQGCVKEDEELPMNECITDNNLIEKTHFVEEDFGRFILYEGSLFICNEDLCNSRQSFIETCFPDQVAQTSTEVPLKSCLSKDGTEMYMPGETAVFGCERCICGGHLNIGVWDCVEDSFLCRSTTPPSLELTEDPSTIYCTFGTDFPNHELNEHFTSGCGDCICDNGVIRCAEGQCPSLLCATTVSVPVFCEEDSFCLFQERISAEFGPHSEIRRSCLPKGDWPYNTTMTDDITVLDPMAISGVAYVCTENLCNSNEYSQGLPVPCEYNGVNYMHMEEFRPDDCNLCVCVSGSLTCTSEPCNGPSCSNYVFDYFSAFLDIPLPRNVTCSFDESCVSAENVTFLESSGVGKATGCLKKTKAPGAGQCTNDTSTIGLFFLGTPMSGSLCTIDNFITTETSTIRVETSATQTLRTSARPTSTRTSKEPPSMSSRTSTKETPNMPSVPTTITSVKEFCSLDGDVGTTISQGPCECTCKVGTNKQPQMACKCVFQVKLTFKDDFSRVANDVENFEREVIATLAKALKIPTEAISNVEIFEGSIVVEATISSETVSTQAELIMMVEEGSFKVTFDGTEFTADNVEISEPETGNNNSKPSGVHTLLFVLAGVFFALAVFAIIFAACFVFHPKRKAHSFNTLTPNENHGYDLPPVEYEPDEKGHDVADTTEHAAVSNSYQRSIVLQQNESLSLPSDPEKCKDQALSSSYQRSLDLQIDEPAFINKAFTTD